MARLSRVGAGEATTCLRVGSTEHRCLNFSDPFGLKPCPGRLQKLAHQLQNLAFTIVQYKNSYRRGIADEDHFNRITNLRTNVNKQLDAYHRDPSGCDDDDNDFRRLRNQATSLAKEPLPEPQMRYGPQRNYSFDGYPNGVFIPGFGIAPGMMPTIPSFGTAPIMNFNFEFVPVFP